MNFRKALSPSVIALTAILFYGSKSSAAAPTFQPPRDTPLVEVAPDKVPTDGISENGQIALKINPSKWKTAETPHFYLHFRRFTEAKKVAREIEYNLAFIASQLGVKPEAYARKSHVYIFEDLSEWASFISKAAMPAWTSSFAYGDELFLNVRGENNTGFDSATLAHETTHAVISRIYGNRRWPLWLNEGFAEYMGSASVASRKNQTLRRFQKDLKHADLPLSDLLALKAYPTDIEEVGHLYQTSEKLVRFLMDHGDSTQFTSLTDRLIDGVPFSEAIASNYSKDFPDFPTFEKAFNAYQIGK